MDFNDAAAQLYGLAPGEFVKARDDLVARARAGGDERTAAAIRSLRKPTLAAWLANQLVRAVPDRIDELTTLGVHLRAVHLAGDGATLRELTPRRHDLVQELVTTARRLARTTGRPITETVAAELADTLDAALVDPGAAQALRAGRLTGALRHVGFGAVDGSAQPSRTTRKPAARSTAVSPGAGKAGTSPAGTPERAETRRRRELRDQVTEADLAHEAAAADRAKAESELDANEHHVSDLATAVERLTQDLAAARAELKRAQRRTPALERTLITAARAAAIAARRRDAARTRTGRAAE